MNEFSYEIETIANVGIHAKLRTAHDGEMKPILGRGGDPKVYRNRTEAIEDLLDHVVRYINGHMVRDGEIAGQTRAEAESVFKPVLRQKGKTRLIAVAYKGQGRKCRKENESNQDRERHDTPTGPST